MGPRQREVSSVNSRVWEEARAGGEYSKGGADLKVKMYQTKEKYKKGERSSQDPVERIGGKKGIKTENGKNPLFATLEKMGQTTLQKKRKTLLLQKNGRGQQCDRPTERGRDVNRSTLVTEGSEGVGKMR